MLERWQRSAPTLPEELALLSKDLPSRIRTETRYDETMRKLEEWEEAWKGLAGD
jgi:hypothetical protein